MPVVSGAQRTVYGSQSGLKTDIVKGRVWHIEKGVFVRDSSTPGVAFTWCEIKY